MSVAVGREILAYYRSRVCENAPPLRGAITDDVCRISRMPLSTVSAVAERKVIAPSTWGKTISNLLSQGILEGFPSNASKDATKVGRYCTHVEARVKVKGIELSPQGYAIHFTLNPTAALPKSRHHWTSSPCTC